MNAVRRTLACALLAVGLLAASAAPALAHANLLGSSPAIKGQAKGSPKQVTLTFSEPVEVVNPTDITIVNGAGSRVDAGTPRTVTGDSHKVVVPLVGTLVRNSYTVRYRVVSSDSHATGGAFVFGVDGARLGAPILAGAGGLSDTSPAAIAARAAELIALGLLLGLIGFRALVWGPGVASARGLAAGEREIALRRGQRLFWRGFWGLTILAGLAETSILVAKSAVVFHTSFLSALMHPASAYKFLAASRFGDMFGWRNAALCALVAVAYVAWTTESAGRPSAGDRRFMAAMAALGVATLALLAGQGHASQAPLAGLSVAADAAHLSGAAIWVGAMPCLLAVLLGAPRLLPDGGGRAIASSTLSRFSKVALWSVVIVGLTGLARATGELSSPEQLFTTGYGRDLMLKASLLLPILMIARRNRRMVAALAGGVAPTAARLRTVARNVQLELMIGGTIVIIAALLVAQIPGRT
jgi:copper transport protein